VSEFAHPRVSSDDVSVYDIPSANHM